MSTALTLHNIDDELYAAVRDYAQEAKMSLSAAFKQLVRRELGLSAPVAPCSFPATAISRPSPTCGP